MADYWGHWVDMGKKLGDKAPKIYQVNWFRKNADGKFIWPGFGDNSRVLDWIIRRVEGEVEAEDGINGRLPKTEDLNLEGLDLSDEVVAELFHLDPDAWAKEADLTEGYFQQFGDKLPKTVTDELAKLRTRIDAAR